MTDPDELKDRSPADATAKPEKDKTV